MGGVAGKTKVRNQLTRDVRSRIRVPRLLGCFVLVNFYSGTPRNGGSQPRFGKRRGADQVTQSQRCRTDRSIWETIDWPRSYRSIASMQRGSPKRRRSCPTGRRHFIGFRRRVSVPAVRLKWSPRSETLVVQIQTVLPVTPGRSLVARQCAFVIHI